MVTALRPSQGGFLRPFGLGLFIRDFLAGLGPFGSSKIDPSEGSYQTEIRDEYKIALFKAHAEDALAREMERRIRKKLPPMTDEEEDRFIQRIRRGIPHKFTSIRSHSFCRYFHFLIQLGWVEATGKEELSAFQEEYPEAEPKRYFRLTAKGREAPDAEWSNPLRAKYNYTLEDMKEMVRRSKEKSREAAWLSKR